MMSFVLQFLTQTFLCQRLFMRGLWPKICLGLGPTPKYPAAREKKTSATQDVNFLKN